MEAPAEVIEGFQLSSQQKQVWRSQQLESAFSYRVQGSILIEGNLNLDLLHQAFQRVIDRHEILRTRFVCLPGMSIPLQVICPAVNLAIAQQDLSHLLASEQAIELELQWQKMSQQPFNFEQDLGLLASLFTLSSVQYRLFVRLPAMNADSATLLNLVHEVSYAYSNQEFAQEPLQYADIAQWQTELLASEEAQIGKEYWQKLSLDVSEVSNLALEHKASELEFNPQYLSIHFDNELAQKITILSQNYSVATANFLLACWQVLIWRFTGQSDFIGVTLNGRKYEELESALGLLSKTIPLPLHLRDDLTFNQLLQQVERSVQEIEQWQEYFELKEAEQNQLAVEFLPISFESQLLEKYHQNSLSFSIQELCSYSDRFKLKLLCLQRSDSLIAELHYDANRFDAADIQRLSENLVALIENAVAQSEISIAHLNLLNDRQRHQLFVEFNQTQADFSQNFCIHQLFAAQAERTPDRIAVVFEDQHLTYRELNCRANQLAHYLQSLDVEPEVIVGICCDRSLEMIVALLGVLKAGGAYLPLDPAMPAERLSLMMQAPTLLLTQRHLLEHVDQLTERIVCLDRDWSLIAQEKSHNCISQVSLENLAYVLYTSGSTGSPKGVAVEHRSLQNYLHGILQRLTLPQSAHFATVSTFAADLGNTVIFSALCSGGCLHVIAQERIIDSEALAHYCRNHEIDCLKIVPSHLSALLAGADAEAILPRHCLILGGEALSWSLVQKVQQLAPDLQVLNHYGPTEATIGALTYSINQQSADASATVPIGRALANTQIYLLDSHLHPVPIGVAGELYIGGTGLARGYLNQPELTAERFIDFELPSSAFELNNGNSLNPDSKIQNPKLTRLYKTGDLARYLADGTLEFLGRVDHQVKIRGFRIELGEIEAVLKQHPTIAEAVVVSKQDALNEPRLVAYVLPQATLDLDQLHRFLSTKLPDYMLPSAYITLKTLPLTANGKLDRQALPAPDFTSSKDFVAPRTPTEQRLAEIWADVLKLEQVGIHDNFFELGGHSLLATQVVSQLRQVFQVELPLQHLFESPTIAELSDVIAQKQTESTDAATLAQMLVELEELSEEDAQNLLKEINP